jgi:hypothetical protein
VRGTVPQRLDIPEGEITEAVELMFRPDKVYQNHYVTLRLDDMVLTSQKRMIMTPGEMAEAKLTPALLERIRGKTLTVDITREKQG